MSVIVTVRVSGDAAKFEEFAKSNPGAVERVMAVAKRNGLIAHRWYRGESDFMAIDEWPDGESFYAFFEGAGEEIGPLMEAAGVTTEPTVEVLEKMDVGDDFGWD